MSWLRRVLDYLQPRREPMPPEQRKIIKRADALLSRADRVIGEIRRLDRAPH